MDYTEKLQRKLAVQRELIAKLEENMDSVPDSQKSTQAFTLKLMKESLEHYADSKPDPSPKAESDAPKRTSMVTLL